MENILIIEDNQDVNLMLSQAIKEAGYNVKSSFTGTDGLNEIKTNSYNLILLDIMLPYKSGDQILKEVRESSSVPIIIISAKDMISTKIDLLKLGADDYITKPFRVRELISRINAVLRRNGKSQSDNKKVLKFGDLSIHTLEARVFKNGEEVLLTSAEYKLLLILIQNENTVLSRNKILEKLWDVTYDFINDNTLSVYIKRLREKIEDDSSKPKYIITVRGLCYKWNGSGQSDNTK